MNKFLYLLFTTSLLFILAANASLAQPEYKNSIYLNLYYDNGNISVGDEFEELTISASAIDFIPLLRPYPLYTASLFDGQGKLLVSAKIDQRGGNSSIKQGLVTIVAPFDIKTERVDILSDRGQKIISLPFKVSSACNYNKICEDFLGETKNACSEDCAPKINPSSSANISPTPSQSPEEQSSGNALTYGVWIFSGIVLIAGIAMIIIARRRQAQ